MPIYKNIKQLAKQKNIQQKDLAIAFGITENQMTNYLTGRSKIIADQVPLFAKLLRVSIEELYSLDFPKKPEPEPTDTICLECKSKENRINELMKKLTDIQEKYTKCLEEMLGKKGSSISNSA